MLGAGAQRDMLRALDNWEACAVYLDDEGFRHRRPGVRKCTQYMTAARDLARQLHRARITVHIMRTTGTVMEAATHLANELMDAHVLLGSPIGIPVQRIP